MRMLSVAVVCLAIGCAKTSGAQSGDTAPKKGVIHIGPSDPNASPPSTFAVPDTDLTLLYSQNFRIEDPAGLGKRSYRAVYGDPQERKSGGCDPVLLELGAGVPELGLQDPKSDHFVPDPPMGGVVLQELMLRCLPDKKATDKNLLGVVAGVTAAPGYSPIAQLVSYKLGGNETYLGTASAFSTDKDGVRRPSAGQTLLAMIVMHFKNRVFLWFVTANDLKIFSQLLSMRVRFGQEEPWPLVPFNVADMATGDTKGALPR